MFNIINDMVHFPEAPGKGRTVAREYNTYPYRAYQASAALSGFDYGFSDVEGMFFRCTINVSTEIVTEYRVRVTITYGLRSREFDKRIDATVNYAVFIQQH